MNDKRIAGAVLFLLTASLNLFAAEFMPLANGNAWTYRDAAGESFTIRVGTPVFMGGAVYHILHGYTTDPLLVRYNQYGNLVYHDEELQQDILLTSFERIRARWEAPRRVCTDMAETLEARGVHDGPTGRWDVVRILYHTSGCADAGLQSEQFTENIGMVRRVVQSIAGPRTFDLVYARLGSQTITAGKVGAFTISAVPAVESGGWLATLRLDHPVDSPLRLRFPSSQEYDLRLRDSEGNILWTWSADKLFVQTTHERVVTGGLRADVLVPFPPSVPEGRQVYTLEAWITSVETDPRFAASTSVEQINLAVLLFTYPSDSER